MDIRWRIELLGGLRARQGERTITQFKTRKAEALLACLLLRPDQPCRREELSQMLWSRDEEREALLHRLNIALSELRHILTDPDLFPRSPSPNVCLDPAAVVTDVADFERLLAEAAQAGGVDERVRLLRAATALYRGELMPGYGEEWIKAERDELAQKHREALGALTQALITAEDFAGALEQAERWVRAVPRDERAHRTLMEVYAALGRTPEALRHYDSFERTLHAEHQAPDPKTQALAERLRVSVVRLAPVSALPLAHPASTNAVAPDAVAPDAVAPDLDRKPKAPPSGSPRLQRYRAVGLAALCVAGLYVAGLAGSEVWKAERRDPPSLSGPNSIPMRDRAGLLCQRGRAQWNQRTRVGMESALHSFQEAALIAPEYAPAYAGLADTYGLQGYYGWKGPAETFDPEVQNARKAVHWATDAHERAEAYTSLGWADMMDWQWDAAQSDFTKAIAFDRKYPTAHQWYSLWLIIHGDKDDSETEIGEAAGGDLSSSVIPKSMGQRLYYSGKYDKAVRKCAEALLSHPDDPLTTLWLGLAYEKLGNRDKASFSLHEAVRLSGRRDVSTLAALGHFLAVSGETRSARLILKELQARRDTRNPEDYVSPVALALIGAGLFDAERSAPDKAAVLQQLEAARRDHSGDLIVIGIEPRFSGLASDPRFRQLKRQIGV